ncbi:PA14 domain-containing protein [Methylomonas sp. MgM2]
MNLSKWLKASLGVLAIASSSPGVACDAPVGRFCVDFFRGTELQGKPIASRKTPFIKYDWKNHSPVRRALYDNFSARWRGNFDFKDGPYEFRALADDGVRILLDGKPILDHWREAAGTELRVQTVPGAGNHIVEVEYFEAKGNARIEVNWQQVEAVAPIVTPAIDAETSSTTNVKTQLAMTAPVRNSNKAPIGINLSAFTYYSSTVPFKDLLMQSGDIKVLKQNSNEPCAEQPSFNSEGFPSSLPNGCLIRIWSVFHIKEDDFWPEGVAPYQPGHYVLLYQGQGKIRLGWDAKNVVYKDSGRIEFDVPAPKSGIQLEITSMEWNDPIREMHIVHSTDEATFRQQPFNEKWLELLKPFQVLRFKDWGALDNNISVYYSPAIAHTKQTIKLPDSAPAADNTFVNMVAMLNVNNKWPRVLIDGYDGASRTLHLKTPIEVSTNGRQPVVNILDFTNRTWSERALPTTFGQASRKGVAFETMIKLANMLGADPWISIPTAADDKFVEALATLIKKELNPNLKCYIEYSNETWNYGYPGYHYSEAKARQLSLTGTIIPADAWHSYRAIEIFRIFNKVFGEPDIRENGKQSRLVRVLTSQTAWFDRAKSVMDWSMPNNAWPTNGLPAYKYADAWAVTTYFYLDKDQSLQDLGIEDLMSAQIDNINTLFGDSKNPGLIRQLLTEAKARGMQLVAYEGGTHVLAPQTSPDLIAKVAQVNKDPRMKDVYTVMLNHWNALYKESGPDAVGVLNHYSDIGRYGKYGYWGLLQSVYQDAATVPRYQAITDFIGAP